LLFLLRRLFYLYPIIPRNAVQWRVRCNPFNPAGAALCLNILSKQGRLYRNMTAPQRPKKGCCGAAVSEKAEKAAKYPAPYLCFL
jgi:hypothetical protein